MAIEKHWQFNSTPTVGDCNLILGQTHTFWAVKLANWPNNSRQLNGGWLNLQDFCTSSAHFAINRSDHAEHNQRYYHHCCGPTSWPSISSPSQVVPPRMNHHHYPMLCCQYQLLMHGQTSTSTPTSIVEMLDIVNNTRDSSCLTLW